MKLVKVFVLIIYFMSISSYNMHADVNISGVDSCSGLTIEVFSPNTINSLFTWFDSSDSSTIILNGSNVSQWNDKSVNGYDVSQGTSAQQPIYNSEQQNGLALITFDGTDELRNTSYGDYDQFSVFIVGEIGRTADSAQCFFETNEGTLANRGVNLFRDGSVLKGRANDSGANREVSDSGISFPAFHLFELHGDATSFELWRDGVLIDSDTYNGSLFYTQNTLIIGSLLNVAFRLFGTIGEFVLYNESISTSDREKLRDYFNNKWAIY